MYARYFRKVYAFAYSLTRNAEAAEELTQKLYDELLEICPSYDIQPGIVLTDWGYSDW